MVAHIPSARHFRRQDDPLPGPPVAGIDGAVTVDANPDATTLAADSDPLAGPEATETAPPLVQSSIPVITRTSAAPTKTAVPPVQSASGATGKQVLPLSTVVGACLGALAGAVFLILIGLYCYKRSTPKGRARHPNSPLSANRNAQGDVARNRSRMEDWNKLGDMDDKWESKYQTKEISSPETASVGPMEKLTMFKSPSIRTAYTHRSEEHPAFDVDPHPFAAYHPGLAQDMAKAEPDKPAQATARQFLGRVDVGPAISWESQGSFLSMNSRISGSMSPTPGFAIPTPNITSSEPHRWESAEVLHYTEDHSNNPFLVNDERRKSAQNPFFGAHAFSPQHNSVVPEIITPPTPNKGKARDLTGSNQDPQTSSDPFGDENGATGALRPSISASSVTSNDRAMQSLIAALDFDDLTPEAVNERLRVASLQPSIMSNASAYTSGGEEDVTKSFPLPPGDYSPGGYSKP